MSLNIKNEETHRLARELAELAGESLTTAVTEALRERAKTTGEPLLFVGGGFAQTDVAIAL